MKIVIAPQAFKGNLSAFEAAEAMECGLRRVLPQAQVVLLPVADGGDGTAEVLVRATKGRFVESEVSGPLGTPVRAQWGLLGDEETAVIEMAAASGLVLVPPERQNPCLTTTYGTGQLIGIALDAGCRRLIVGVGGSATVDGGAGMAQALGVRLLDADGQELAWGGAALARLAHIDLSGLDPRLKRVSIEVASDVSNPLCGPQGAAAVYGPQKGATPEMVEELEAALGRCAEVVERDLGFDIKHVPGAGAAGGLGAGSVAFLGARLRKGAEVVLNILGFDEAVRDADLVLTGEGRLDGQIAFGKAPAAVAERAKVQGVPVVAVVGSLGEGYEAAYAAGIDAVIPVGTGPMAVEEALRRADELLEQGTERAMRLLLTGARLRI